MPYFSKYDKNTYSFHSRLCEQFNMPAHARAAVISMEARAKKGDTTYRLTDPEVSPNWSSILRREESYKPRLLFLASCCWFNVQDETYLLTVQFYDRTSIINPCLDSSVEFVKKLVAEVKQMHTEAGVPLDSYHFGGDEAKNILLQYNNYPSELKQRPFSKSPACEAKAQADASFDIEKVRREDSCFQLLSNPFTLKRSPATGLA